MQTEITRRTFVTGACAAAALWTSRAAHAVPRRPFDLVIADSRFDAGRRFAAALAARGAAVVDASEDLARLWYSGLRQQAGRGTWAVAGLTTWADFTIMRGCCAERRLHVGYEGLHDARKGMLRHEIRSRGPVEHLRTALQTGGETWPTALAAALSEHATEGGTPECTAELICPQRTDHRSTLYSWLIA